MNRISYSLSFLLFTLCAQISFATKQVGCSSINSKKINSSLFKAICNLPTEADPKGMDRVVSLLYSKTPRPTPLWEIESEDWNLFVSEHKKAEILGMNPGHLVDLIANLEKTVTPKEKPSFSELIVRLNGCNDGEISEQFASTLSRNATENPVLFLRSVSIEQKRFEERQKVGCRKKIQDSYLAPALTSSVLTTLMSQWEGSQAPANLVKTVDREKDLKNDPNLKPLMTYILGN